MVGSGPQAHASSRSRRPSLRVRCLRTRTALCASVAISIVLGGCASTGSTSAGTVVPSSSTTAQTGPGGSRLTYAALGASETYGIGANPITNGYAYRLRDDLHLSGDAYADVAIPGATLADAFQTELTNALAIRPSLCTVFFGVNDVRGRIPLAQFKSDLTDLVTTLIRAHAQVMIIGLPQLADLPALRSASSADLATLTEQWNTAIQAVASATGAHYLSLEPFSSELIAHPEEIAGDGLHPSNAGHARLADVIFAALQSNGLVPR
jgi:lysophospholipase L1-like esterase